MLGAQPVQELRDGLEELLAHRRQAVAQLVQRADDDQRRLPAVDQPQQVLLPPRARKVDTAGLGHEHEALVSPLPLVLGQRLAQLGQPHRLQADRILAVDDHAHAAVAGLVGERVQAGRVARADETAEGRLARALLARDLDSRLLRHQAGISYSGSAGAVARKSASDWPGRSGSGSVTLARSSSSRRL